MQENAIEDLTLWIDETKRLNRSLTDLEKVYWTELFSKKTISGVIEHFLAQGILVHFDVLLKLIQDCVLAGIFTNPEFKGYFIASHLEANAPSHHYQRKDPKSVEDLKSLPFFRNLPVVAVEKLWEFSERVSVSAGQTLFAEGDSSREMYLLISGTLGLYRKTEQGGQIRINEFTPGAVFGEGGFLLGSPRAGTVRAGEQSELLRFVLPSEEFGKHLDLSKVRNLQPRMWALNAVLKSHSLRLLPADSIDQLIFSGRSVDFPAGTIIFKEGTKGASFYVLVQGSVAIAQSGKVINVMQPGSCFGEIALFFSRELRTASATAQTQCSAIEIPREAFYKLLTRNLALAREIERIGLERLEKDRKRTSGPKP